MTIRSFVCRILSELELWQLSLVYCLSGIEGVVHRIRYLRNPIPALKKWGARIGRNTLVYPGLTVHAAKTNFDNLSVGDEVRILRDCLFDITETIEISDKVIISSRCCLITHLNIHQSPLASYGYAKAQAPIVIEEGAVLFANATVLMGVKIGQNSMVAAGAVVTSDVPPWTLVAGSCQNYKTNWWL